MSFNTVHHIARQELTINIRNRWTLIFAVVFGVLVMSIASIGTMAEGYSGMQSFTRTSASLLNLVLYIVPLVSLIMGTLSFTGDRGTTELLFAQPVTRTDVLLGKVIGLFSSIALATIAGFTVSGIMVAAGQGVEGVTKFIAFVALSLALSLVFLSIAVVTATGGQRKSRAFGVALFLWFWFVFFYDFLVMGTSMMLRGEAANTVLFLSLLGNPVDMVRVAALLVLDNASVFGAAGAALVRFVGGSMTGTVILLCGLIGWTATPLWFAHRMLRTQDI